MKVLCSSLGLGAAPRWTRPVKWRSWTSTSPLPLTPPAGAQQSFRFSSQDTGELLTSSKATRSADRISQRWHSVSIVTSYNPYDGPNDNPEVELPLTAGEYIYVYGDMDDDGFYEGEPGVDLFPFTDSTSCFFCFYTVLTYCCSAPEVGSSNKRLFLHLFTFMPCICTHLSVLPNPNIEKRKPFLFFLYRFCSKKKKILNLNLLLEEKQCGCIVQYKNEPYFGEMLF